MSAESQTSVSLLEHLHETLLPLLNIEALPSSLHAEVSGYVKPSLSDSFKEIPYDCLLRISRWAGTTAGKLALRGASLDPSDYLIISLLAGLVTSPSAVLGPYKPPPSAQELRRNAARDRRAVIALINALFSVIGVGVAVWHASGTTGWNHDMRVLCSIFAGFVVAFAEGGLYYIWSRRASSRRDLPRLSGVGATTKIPPPLVSLEIPPQPTNVSSEEVNGTDELPDGLRRRAVPVTSHDSASS